MTAIPPSPPSSHPSFPPLIFLLSHFPFCIWHLVFVCAVNTLGTSRRNPSFSPCRTTNTHVLHISHIVSDQHFVFSVHCGVPATIVPSSHLSFVSLPSFSPSVPSSRSLIFGFKVVYFEPSTANNCRRFAWLHSGKWCMIVLVFVLAAALIHNEISQYWQDGPPCNAVEMFIFPRGWTLMTLMVPWLSLGGHKQFDICAFREKYLHDHSLDFTLGGSCDLTTNRRPLRIDWAATGVI